MKATVKTSPPTTPPPSAIRPSRWPAAMVIQEARKRTREMSLDNSRRVRAMLEKLLIEAGWQEADFIDVLCQNVIDNNKPSNG